MSKIKLKLVLEVLYAQNGTSESELKTMLEDSVNHAVGNGLLTGETQATVDTWSCNVEKVSRK